MAVQEFGRLIAISSAGRSYCLQSAWLTVAPFFKKPPKFSDLGCACRHIRVVNRVMRPYSPGSSTSALLRLRRSPVGAYQFDRAVPRLPALCFLAQNQTGFPSEALFLDAPESVMSNAPAAQVDENGRRKAVHQMNVCGVAE